MSSIILKLLFQQQMRRFDWDMKHESFSSLIKKVSTLFSIANEKDILFTWIDEQNDRIVFDTDDEFKHIVRCVRRSGINTNEVLRLEVQLKNSTNEKLTTSIESTSVACAIAAPIHDNVTCDECGMSPIIGVRFKCSTREDFDLCANCEVKIIQPFSMIKIYLPEQAPQAILIALRDRHHDRHHGRHQGHGFGHHRGRHGIFGPNFGPRGCGPMGWQFARNNRHGNPNGVDSSEASKATVDVKPMARFIKDVTFPDGTTTAPNSKFIKIWKLRNDGEISWPETVGLVANGGDLMTEDNLFLPVVSLGIGEEADVSLTLTAPINEGRYISYFRLVTKQGDEGVFFGQRLWVDIRVEAEDHSASWQVVSENLSTNEYVNEDNSLETPSDVIHLYTNELRVLKEMGFTETDSVLSALKEVYGPPSSSESAVNAEAMCRVVMHLLGQSMTSSYLNTSI